MKQEFIKALMNNVKRNGIENLIEFLDNSDFFTAPASVKFHGNHPGGLVDHSLSVYRLLEEKNSKFKLPYSAETIAIVGLLHDICKVDFYKEDKEPATAAQLNYLKGLSGLPYNGITKNYASELIGYFKSTEEDKIMPEEKIAYTFEDSFPYGHGEKSTYIINKFIALLDDEALAIRWHMGPYSSGVNSDKIASATLNTAVDKCPLIVALFCADYESAKLLNK